MDIPCGFPLDDNWKLSAASEHTHRLTGATLSWPLPFISSDIVFNLMPSRGEVPAGTICKRRQLRNNWPRPTLTAIGG